MTPYVKKLLWRGMPAQQKWNCVASLFRGGSVEDSAIDQAVRRLVAGDVSRTDFGIRVAVNEGLGDDRSASGAKAYWPEKKNCLCWSKKSRGECSHELAAEIFDFEIDDETLDGFDYVGYLAEIGITWPAELA